MVAPTIQEYNVEDILVDPNFEKSYIFGWLSLKVMKKSMCFDQIGSHLNF